MTRLARTSIALGVCGALVGALAGCGVTRGDDSRDLLMIIPNSPGGGYDLTGRDAVQVMEDDDITGGCITVDNIVGAGGAVAMTELVGKVGDEHTMMTVGLGVVGSTYSFGSPFGLKDATPLAQLMSEPEGILVPGDSPFETVHDFLDAWKDDPGSLAVGGGSSPGGPDHLFPMQLARRSGSTPTTSTSSPTTAADRSPAPCWARRSTPASRACRSSRGPSTPASCGCWPSPARSATPTAARSPRCPR